MTNNNIIPEELFAAVIDGVATSQERQSVYTAIKGDDELREMFDELIYAKIFEEEIESNFQMRYAGQTVKLKSDKPEGQTISFNDVSSLSAYHLTVNKNFTNSDRFYSSPNLYDKTKIMSTNSTPNTIPDELFAAVIDGVATNEEHRLVYTATQGDDEQRQIFNNLIYMKTFEVEIETDFQTRYAGQTVELDTESEKPAQTTLFNRIFLSGNKSTIDSDNPEKNRER
ncbi:MAG: hypothetical protein LBH80_07815 [Prevotellaceae bacterium]|jgi:hypothetical protein|nr:hypothetical protein [Prevotellaceae bacterium]